MQIDRYRSGMPTGRSNAVLVTDLLTQEGPYQRAADDFLKACCAHCGRPLVDDPRYGEWGTYCTACYAAVRSA